MEPQLLFTKQNHTPVVNLRVGTTPRRVDVTTGEWRDLPSSFFTVNCWRRLAYSVSASLHKGDPVIIRGRLKSRAWNDNGRVRTAVDIEAESVGHDMTFGWSHYMRGLHPSTEEMLAKMGIAETPYGTVGSADISADDGTPFGGGASYTSGPSYGGASYGGASYGGASYGGDASYDRGASSAQPSGPGEHIEAATIEAERSETEDSAGMPDGELADGGVPF
jgi:single-strand DNA-binding protein